MNKSSKIYIAGHRGMVGSAVWRALESRGYYNLVGKNSTERDLRNQQAVLDFYINEKPQLVINAAAKVGGILVNNDFPYQFLMENQDQYEYIFQMLSKMYSMARIGISVDFMTTHVDWKEENTFYMEPGKLFEFGKNLSQKVILRSDYLPFEQCIYIMR